MPEKKSHIQPGSTSASVRLSHADLETIEKAAEAAGISRNLFFIKAALALATADDDTQKQAIGDYATQNQIAAILRRLEVLETGNNASWPVRAPRGEVTPPEPAAPATPQPRVNQILRGTATEHDQQPAPVPESPAEPAAVAPRYDLPAILETIETMRKEQVASGIKSNQAIARALDAAGLRDARGGTINASQITTFISRHLPHLMQPDHDKPRRPR